MSDLVSNLNKGFLYPSQNRSRCAAFHPCLLTQKCQSYNRNSLVCNLCESRIMVGDTNVQFGGYISEGEIMPDLQERSCYFTGDGKMSCFSSRQRTRN